MISLPLVRYVLLAALRDRLVLSLALLIVVGACLAIFLGSSATIEGDKFSLVFAGAGLKLAGMVGLILFTVFHIRRSFESRDVDFLLSRPLSRTSFILSHALGFSILAIILALCVGAIILLMSAHRIGAGHGLWIAGLVAEYVIMVNAALFFAMVISSGSGAALAVFGLYVLGNLIGDLLGDAAMNLSGAYSHILLQSMNVIAMIMPRLDLMTQTTWLVYPEMTRNVGLLFILAQGVVYSGLLISATLIDLRRRQF